MDAPAPNGRPAAPAEAERWEDWLTLAFGVWLIAGLFVDGYAHAYVIDTDTEDFFTPWHGIFYAGFAALVMWVGFIAYRRRGPGPVRSWLPPSYRPAAVGLGVFAIGGIGDGIWHTAFGVEIGIDALLSPTHLVLLGGGLVAMWTPIRSSARRADRSALLAVGTAALVTAVLVFFIEFLWFISYPGFAADAYNPVTGEGTVNVQRFFGGAVAAVAVLLGPLLLIARQWPLPLGAATGVWGMAAVLESLAFSQRLDGVLAAVAGGLAFDAAYRLGRDRGWRLRAAAAVGPMALFAVYLINAALDTGVGWPPEIWGGLVAVAGFVGFGLVLIQESGRELSPYSAAPLPPR